MCDFGECTSGNLLRSLKELLRMNEGQRVGFYLKVQSSFTEVCFLLSVHWLKSALHYRTKIHLFPFMGAFVVLIQFHLFQ